MLGVIKGALKEELENSLRMKKKYEKALEKLPRGSLVKRTIKGHLYYYLVMRDGKKLKYVYKGKITDVEKKKYKEAKLLRAKYRNLLSQLKKQIKFLRSSLRGKEPI